MYMLISSGPFTERKDRLHSVATALANNVLPEVDAHAHTVQKVILTINTIVTVTRLITCCLAYIWMRWREHVGIIVSGRLDDMRKQQMMARFVKHMLGCAMSKAFSTWVAKFEERKHLKRAARRVLLRWTQQGLAAAWHKWCSLVLEKKVRDASVLVGNQFQTLEQVFCSTDLFLRQTMHVKNSILFSAANSAHELSLDLIAVRTELEAVVQCQIKQGQLLENCESVIDTLRNEKLYKRLHANDLFARDFSFGLTQLELIVHAIEIGALSAVNDLWVSKKPLVHKMSEQFNLRRVRNNYKLMCLAWRGLAKLAT